MDSEQNEQIVREYFECRGWIVTKLDQQGTQGKSTDFRICRNEVCFLCEVKTIESVRADFSSSPSLRYFLQEPDRQRVEQEEWYRRKYSSRKRYTQDKFRKFVNSVQNSFAQSNVRHLPYIVSIHNHNLYIPTPEETTAFCKWLKGEIGEIHRCEIDWHPGWHTWRGDPQHSEWTVFGQGSNLPAHFLGHYLIHDSKDESDLSQTILVSILGPGREGDLELSIPFYGTLNLGAIDRQMKEGVKQLRNSAAREKDSRMARVIVLIFNTTLGFDQPLLFKYIPKILKKYSDLSAIAVLDSVPEGTPPPKEQGFHALSDFLRNTLWVHTFIVFHNSWLEAIKPLDASVFSDKWSIQFSPVKQ